MKEYLIKPSDTEEEVLVNRYAYAIFDMKEYMRKCGLQEDEIDKQLFDLLQTSLDIQREYGH